MSIVNHQNILAMEILQRTNKELLRSVDKAKTVTLAALLTAEIVANAQYNQKITLQKIRSLYEATDSALKPASRAFQEQGGESPKPYAESNITTDNLIAAFVEAMSVLDEIKIKT